MSPRSILCSSAFLASCACFSWSGHWSRAVQWNLSAVALAPDLSSETAYCRDSSQLTSFKRRGAVLAEMLAAGVVLVQCTSALPPPAATPSPAVTPSPSAASSSASAPPAPAGGTVEPVTAAELGASWRPGCPVEPGRLRRVNVDHIGFDGQTHHGELIVHEDLVPEVIAIFEQLYRLGYPVEKIRTVDHYSDADDELSMPQVLAGSYDSRFARRPSSRWRGLPGLGSLRLRRFGSR